MVPPQSLSDCTRLEERVRGERQSGVRRAAVCRSLVPWLNRFIHPVAGPAQHHLPHSNPLHPEWRKGKKQSQMGALQPATITQACMNGHIHFNVTTQHVLKNIETRPRPCPSPSILNRVMHFIFRSCMQKFRYRRRGRTRSPFSTRLRISKGGLGIHPTGRGPNTTISKEQGLWGKWG